MADWRAAERFATCKGCRTSNLRAVRADGTDKRVLYIAEKRNGKIEATNTVHLCDGSAASAARTCDFCGKTVRLMHDESGYHLLDGASGTDPHKGRCNKILTKEHQPEPEATEAIKGSDLAEQLKQSIKQQQGNQPASGQQQQAGSLDLAGEDGADTMQPTGSGSGSGESDEQNDEQQPAPDSTDAMEVLARTLAPKLDRLLKPKNDKQAVKKMVEEAVVTTLAERETPRALTLTIKNAETGEQQELGLSHVQLPQLVRAIKRHRHVYLHGAPGGGKGFAVRQAAQALGRPTAYLSLSPATPEWRLTGYMDAHGTYRATSWREAVDNGAIFCLDEADNSSAAALVALNETLANGYAAFPDKEVRVHDLFAVVAIGNTLGRGGVRGHETRQALDMATLDRFALIEWHYDPALETALIKPVIGEANAPILQQWAVSARNEWKRINPADLCPLTPRMLVRLATALAEGDEWDAALAEAGGARFGENLRKLPAAPKIKRVAAQSTVTVEPQQ